MSSGFTRTLAAPLFALFCLHLSAQAPAATGIFQGQSDIGSIARPSSLVYSAANGAYTMTAAGDDLWAKKDGFHFAWKQVSGDVALTADIDFPNKTGDHHQFRKAVLMFRQTLDADGAYADVALHGSGLAALQYRPAKGDNTLSAETTIVAPRRLRLEKRGDVITMYVSSHGEPPHPVGATIKLHFDGPFYVGIGLCSHNPTFAEKAVFSNLELTELTAPSQPAQTTLYASLQAISIAEDYRRSTIVYFAPARIQAPNWSRDGNSLTFTQNGRIYTVPVTGGEPVPMDTGNTSDCSGSHGFSPDGKWFAVSCASPGHPDRQVFIVPAGGGAARLLTQNTAYFHSWSPDGKTILFTRGGPNGSLDIFSISVDGGPETRLTTGAGVSDDPDYSPDGKYIYFNTDRWGGMQLARMRPDGRQPEQITFDNFKNWTAHPSPDGKSIVFISYDPSVTTHAANKDIALRILTPQDGKIRTLVHLVGGDGSMNVPNWSPDSKRVAFVSYQFLPADNTGANK
jgi:Tol biopolymer transport system component